jgi:DNA-directed RNA polymerase alpha subunit
MYLDWFHFSMRTLNVIRKANLETIIDVISLTEVQFNRLAGCGSKTTREMKKFLNTNGLDFSPVPINELTKLEICSLHKLLALRENREVV